MSAEVRMPPGSLLKWHVFIFNLVGGCGVCFVLCYQRGGMGLYVKCKLQHQERKSNIQEQSESLEGSSPAAPSLTAPT